MIAANRNIETDFAIGTHQRKLVGVALIMEELRKVGLVAFNIPYMDEGDALPEVPRNIAERFGGILFNAETRRRRVRRGAED